MYKKSKIKILEYIPTPLDLKKHIIKKYDINKVWDYIRPSLLYNKLLGFKGNFNLKLKNKNEKATKLFNDIKEIKNIVINSKSKLMTPKFIYKFYLCHSSNNSINILNDSKDNIIYSIKFPRQQIKEYLCISDFINPTLDYIAFCVLTTGENINKISEKWKKEGKYKYSILLQMLALASVEALAEIVHKEIRINWGIENCRIDKDDIFKRNYRGLRYSFGYPSCPDLSKQKIIFDLLNPVDIGINLTDSYMMEPESSISAFVIHHPQAKYFSI